MRQMANDLASRMLEDPSYESIVKWGDNGESFVVLNVRIQAEQGRHQSLTLFTE